MFDAELQIVDSEIVDISENAEQLSATFDIGRRGFPRDAHFTVHIEDTSADTACDPVKFVLQVAVDDGTVYHDLATIDLQGNASVSKPGPYSVAIGPWDPRAEIRSATDITIRVAVRYTDAGGTDNFTYSAYITGGNPFPAYSSLGVYHE